jgi:hypothetical protein
MKVGEPGHDRAAFALGHGRPPSEEAGIVAAGEVLGFGQDGVEFRGSPPGPGGAARGGPGSAVVHRRSRHGRNPVDPAADVVVVAEQRGDLQRR